MCKFLNLLAVCSLTTVSAEAMTLDDLQLAMRPHGKLFSNVYVPVPGNGQPGTLVQQLQGAQLELSQRFSETQSAALALQALSATATADPKVPRSELDIREAYYRYSNGGWELRAGRQIISWGKSDVITPTDFLVGTDFRLMSPLIENRRIGADGAQLSWTPNQGDSPWNFTAVWNADFARSTLLLPPGSSSANSEMRDPDHPEISFENSETAFKASYLQSSWDLSLSYFHGWNHTPQLTKGGVAGGLEPLVIIEPRYTQIEAVGADASFSFEKYVWRFESAYTRTDNDNAATALYQPSHLDAVTGIERPFGTDWRVQLQAVARYFPRYRDPDSETGMGPVGTAINRQIAKANSLAQGYDRRWKAGATARIAYGNDEATWNPEIFAIYYPATEELMLRPRLLYRYTQSLQFDAGLQLYIGPDDTVIGRYKPFSAYFLEGRWLF